MVGPGVSTFYFGEAASGFPADLFNFWDALKGIIGGGVTVTVPDSGDLIDVATGELSGTWTDTGGGAISSTGIGDYALGVGARIRWHTNGVVGGRRVVGSTFIVPLAPGSYQSSLGLTNAVVTTLTAAAGALFSAASGPNHVYSKPRPGRAGSSHPVVSASAPDAVSWLRSRRT